MSLPRVGFVCIGNACRSQMAEGFARYHARDLFEAHSAGLAPALRVPDATVRIMAEKGIDLSEAFPKDFSVFPKDYFELVVNLSGYPLDGFGNVREWRVRDPYGASDKTYRAVRDEIEKLVLDLAAEFKRSA